MQDSVAKRMSPRHINLTASANFLSQCSMQRQRLVSRKIAVVIKKQAVFVMATLATLGYGIEVHESTLGVSAGRGLYASRRYKHSEVITVYDGKAVHATDIPSAVHSEYTQSTHIASIPRCEYKIIGLQTPERGRGGGSFANHHPHPNCKLVVCPARLVQSHRYDGIYDRVPCLALQALRSIKRGEEPFIKYSVFTTRKFQRNKP